MHAEIVKHVNLELRRLADQLPTVPDHRFGFNCECGCGQRVALTAAEYDWHEGAWADRHEPKQGYPGLSPTSPDAA
jgi:hypothetical protein